MRGTAACPMPYPFTSHGGRAKPGRTSRIPVIVIDRRGQDAKKTLLVQALLSWIRRGGTVKREKPTSVSDLLGKGQGLLGRLREGSAAADRTLQAVRRGLPEDLAGRVWGASVRSGRLTLLVSSAAWATRIRYHAPSLRETAGRDLGTELEKVVIRVRPAGSGER